MEIAYRENLSLSLSMTLKFSTTNHNINKKTADEICNHISTTYGRCQLFYQKKLREQYPKSIIVELLRTRLDLRWFINGFVYCINGI